MSRLLSALVLAMLLAPGSAPAEKLQQLAPAKAAPGGERRVALLIGNSAYQSAPLRNPVNDARAMARSLAETGFAVTLLEDATGVGMRRAIRAFGDEILRGGVGLFYYAGHGMQVRGKNFLVPVNADIQREDEVEDQAVDANLVLTKMDSARNSLNLMILDACRNNPFARSFRSAAQGLAQMDAPSGTLIAFATAPGQVAADGDGANGLYTKHLLTAMRQPGLPVEQLFKQVRISVTKETADRQIPWESSSLKGDFFFLPPDPGAGAAAQKATIERAVGDAVRAEQDKAAAERAALQEQMKQLIEQMLGKQRADLDAELKKRETARPLAPAAPAASVPTPAAPEPPPVAKAEAKPPVQVAALAPASVAAGKPGMPKAGDRWVYSSWDPAKPAQKRQTSAEIKGADERAILDTWHAADGTSGERAHTSGVYQMGPAFSPYLLSFQSIKVGDRWENVPFQNLGNCRTDPFVQCRVEAEVTAREKVTVAAGTFDAYRIRVTIVVHHRGGVGTRETDFWFAEEAKRMVKFISRVRNLPVPEFDGELVSYKLN